MRRLLLSLLLLLPSAAFSATPLSGWSHVVPVTTDATLIDEATHVVPVFLSEGDTAFWTAVKSDGSDIRVTEDDGSTILPHYLVSTFTESGTTGTGCLLVNASSILSAASDVEFWIHVGNAGASSTSSGSDVFSGTDIEAFYLPGVTTTDITGNGYDLTAVNSPTTAASDYEGITAAVYNGTSQYHYFTGAMPLENAPFTLNALASIDNLTDNAAALFIGDSGSASKNFAEIIFRGSSGAGDRIALYVWGDSGALSAAETTASFSASTWTMLTGTRSGTGAAGTSIAYKDGGVSGSDATTTVGAASMDTISIGAKKDSAADTYLDGEVAVARVDSVVRSADYVSTEKNAWHDADFLTWAATEGTSDTGWQLFTSASTVTPGNTTWTNASNALTDDSNYASADIPNGDTSYTLKLTGADLSAIPSDATIAGWEYRISYTGEDGGTAELYDHTVQPIIAGTQSGDDQSRGALTQWTDSSVQTTDFGDETEKYSLTPTVANMKDSGTGLAIRVQSDGGSTAEARIYTAWIRVHWTPAGSGPTAADKARGFLGVGP